MSTVTAPLTINLRLPSRYAAQTKPGASDVAATQGPESGMQPPPLDWMLGTWAVTHSTLSMWRTARNVRITVEYEPAAGKKSEKAKEKAKGKEDGTNDETSSPAATTGSATAKTIEGVDTADLSLATDASESGPGNKQGAHPAGGFFRRAREALSGDSLGTRGEADGRRQKQGNGATPSGDAQQASVEGKPGWAWEWRGSGWLFFITSWWEVLGWGERTVPGPAADQRSVTERWMVTWFAPTIATAEGLDIYCDRPEGLSDESYRAIVAALEDLGGPVADIVRKDMRSVEIRLPWSKREA